jgi:hypothetical protein
MYLLATLKVIFAGTTIAPNPSDPEILPGSVNQNSSMVAAI